MKKAVAEKPIETPSVKEAIVKPKEQIEYKKEAVFNPFTKERLVIKVKETGETSGVRKAQGWFPIDEQFTVLMEMYKAQGEPEWTITGFPAKPIK